MRIAAALAAALALATAASAATPTATRWVDKKDGFSIVVPPKWYAVPRTVAAVKGTIAAAKKAKQNNLATAYGYYLTANGKSELKAYVFQAFYFNGPSADPVPPVVSVQKNTSAKYTARDLTAAARAYGGQLASVKGARVAAPVKVKLPAGTAMQVTGVVPNGGGVTTGADLYIFVHAGKLYVLSFKANGAALAQDLKPFATIAQDFRFV